MREAHAQPTTQGSPSLVNGGGFRSHSSTVRRFESCPLHHASQHTILKRNLGKGRGR